jgi:Na+/melibiose symporter-like transporter
MSQTQSTRASAIAVPELQPLVETASRGRIIAILIGVILGMLLAGLDQTAVGTALPRIVASLGGLEHYAWVVTAYLLASTVSIPIWGKLSDIYGRRIIFIGGMVIFLAGSALAGTSQDMTQLIIYRGIQGLGAGALIPIAQAVISYHHCLLSGVHHHTAGVVRGALPARDPTKQKRHRSTSRGYSIRQRPAERPDD